MGPFKIGLVGNSCTGKTTSAFALIRLLKLTGHLTAYCTDACRFVTFPPKKFDKDPNARLHVLFSQMANEAEQMVRDDADYVITERTVMDWFLYYEWTCKNIKKATSWAVETLVDEYVNSYDLLILMDSRGMYYVDDGFRPKSTRIRNQVDEMYQNLIERLMKASGTTDGTSTFPECILITGDDLWKRNKAVERKFSKWLDAGHSIIRKPKVMIRGKGK
jgi:hypothetical protein